MHQTKRHLNSPDIYQLFTPLQAYLYQAGAPAQVMQLTGRSYHTVYAWRRGSRFPSHDQAELLARHVDGLTVAGCFERSVPADSVCVKKHVRVSA